MNNIHVHRYGSDEAKDENGKGWAGWIEPDDLSWIAFIDTKGKPVFFLDRDPETGAVIS